MASKVPKDSGKDAAVAQGLDDLIGSLDLRGVTCTEFSGKLRRLGQPDGFDMQLTTAYSIQESVLLYRFLVACQLKGKSDEPNDDEGGLADIAFTMVAEYRRRDESEVGSPDEVLATFGDTVALRLAFPYVREAITSFITRLGFPAITVGLLAPENTIPGSAWGLEMSPS